MFFELVMRNSKRSRKENGLFFISLLVVIIAFYIILSLSHQDVIIFLTKMESNAIDRLLTMIPIFYGMTLFILFFLVYFASKFQLERRQHEFGVYLMMGMRRWKLFFMLLAEDLRNSVMACLIGLPIAILLSEFISLVTARFVGLGIIGHSISISPSAILWTVLGFLFIKMIAFMILSGKIARQEIGTLLIAVPEGTKKQKPVIIYLMTFLTGVILLIIAYWMAIRGMSWYHMKKMGITLLLGFIGTLLLFFGLRSVMGFIAKKGKRNRGLWTFTFRQLEENVIYESNTLAISSILMLAALCCFGAGVAITQFYGKSEEHVLDYTFKEEEGSITIKEKLSSNEFKNLFSEVFEMRVGYIRIAEDRDKACSIDSILESLNEKPDSIDKDILLNNLSYVNYPYLIALTGYNKLLKHAGLPQIELERNEASVYIDSDFITDSRIELLHQVLAEGLECQIVNEPYALKESIQTTNLVVDRSITLSFALIVRDDIFDTMTKKDHNIYLDAVLNPKEMEGKSLLRAISQVNGKLDQANIPYESYLQNLGRQLFYMVAASYITIYLAIIFLVIANTANVVQFLTRQQKTARRYKTLLKLGASYEMLCTSAAEQINYYFGIPMIIAMLNSAFAVRALFHGLLPSRAEINIMTLMSISVTMILLLCVVEFIYILAVKRASNRYILSLVVYDREE